MSRDFVIVMRNGEKSIDHLDDVLLDQSLDWASTDDQWLAALRKSRALLVTGGPVHAQDLARAADLIKRAQNHGLQVAVVLPWGGERRLYAVDADLHRTIENQAVMFGCATAPVPVFHPDKEQLGKFLAPLRSGPASTDLVVVGGTGVDDEVRTLVARATSGSEVRSLSPLSDGLSGALVYFWRATDSPRGIVVKVQELAKHEREVEGHRILTADRILPNGVVPSFVDSKCCKGRTRGAILMQLSRAGGASVRESILKGMGQATVEGVFSQVVDPIHSGATLQPLDPEAVLVTLLGDGWYRKLDEHIGVAGTSGRDALNASLWRQQGRLVPTGTIHGDLHPDNLLQQGEAGDLAVIDFAKVSHGGLLTMDYAAFEVGLVLRTAAAVPVTAEYLAPSGFDETIIGALYGGDDALIVPASTAVGNAGDAVRRIRAKFLSRWPAHSVAYWYAVACLLLRQSCYPVNAPGPQRRLAMSIALRLLTSMPEPST